MFNMEDVFCELAREDVNEQGLPPGFRFHPTDEELITFYLASKVFNGSFCGVDIAEVDLNRCEPWELPDVAKMGEREWYFFSLRDRKYPTGLRTNRATGAGYWKATGKDREVHSASNGALLGMKKTLVFYRGRAPRGEKTKWVMHEYRLDGDFSCRHTCKEEWVICRIFHKTLEKKSSLLEGQNYMLDNCSSPNIGSLPQLLDTSTLLDCQTQAINPTNTQSHNPFFIHNQESNPSTLSSTCQSELSPLLRTLMSNSSFTSQSHPFPINGGLLQPPFPHTITASTKKKINRDTNIINTSPSMLFKSLLSHQDFTLKEQANSMSKQFKTEGNFYHFQPYDTNLHWMDKIIQPSNPYQRQNQNQNQNQPLIFEIDYCSGLSSSSSATADTTTAPVHEMSTSLAFNRTNTNLVEPHIRSVLGESWPLDS